MSAYGNVKTQRSLFPEKYLWKEKVCSGTVKHALISDCAGLKMPIEKQIKKEGDVLNYFNNSYKSKRD